MEQYLGAFINYLQDDWLEWLPLAEFVSNNAESETTTVTPFFANKGFHPRLGFEPSIRPPTNADELNSEAFATRMEEIQNIRQSHMLLVQADHEKHANRHRVTAPQYSKSDLVWLDIRNLLTERPCQKLEGRRAGRYQSHKWSAPTR